MLRKAIHRFIRPRHPWRTIAFDELAEIYTSMSLRSFGLGVIGVFVPIFLYKNGVSLQSIFLFFTMFFVFRIPLAYATAFIVGRIGPKHTLVVSTLALVIFLIQLLTYTTVGWPLALLAITFSISNALFFTAYQTDFSKVKNSEHGGKELGWLYTFERLGGAAGPIAGGLIASMISPQWSIGFAIVVLGGSLIPLFMSNEPVRVHQKITFKGFKWRRHTRDFIALSAFGVDNFATIMLWPLLMGVFIFTDGTYAKLGGVVSLSMLISIFGARMFGKMIDSHNGLALLRYGAVLNVITHFVRPLISTIGGSIVVTVINEPTTLAYRMSLTKGFFDAVDSEQGYRIVFISLSEIMAAVAKALFCLGLFIACDNFDSIAVMRGGFIVAGVLSAGILLQRFPALEKSR